MKYVVQASNVTELYEVKKFTNDDNKSFWKKPEFVKRRIDDWEEIMSFECDCFYDRNRFNYGDGIIQFYISENEKVLLLGEIFRADKCITYLKTNKVLSIKKDKSTNWQAYQDALVEYRDYVFETYPDIKEYFELYCVKDELENIDKIKDIVLKNLELKNRQDAYMDLANSAFYLGRDGIKLFPKN